MRPLPVFAQAALLGVAAVVGAPLVAAAQERPPFERLRQEEDWSPLCDPSARMQPLDALKCIPLSADRSVRLSLGGELRERYEYTRNPTWGEDRQDGDGAFLQRYILQGDLRLGDHLRFFGQLYSALEKGRSGPTSPIDENRLDLQQAFVEMNAPLGEQRIVALRLGRQELRYGSARLVDVREGPNVRRNFNGGVLRLTDGGWRVDALAVRPSRIETGVFDDSIEDDQALWGLYAVGRQPDWLPAGSIDLYYLGYANDAGSYQQGTARERRHTVGARLWGERGGWDWNWEFIYQFGTFGQGDIRAWSVASDSGYTWGGLPWSPRLGLSANIASGDGNPDNDDLGTFNPLFPRGSYFSELALLGPRNFFNVHPFLTLAPLPGVTITTDVDFFWRLMRDDGIYSPSGALLRSGEGTGERYVGTAFSLNVGWEITPALQASVVYGHFFPGAFVEATGPSRDVDYFELTLKAQF